MKQLALLASVLCVCGLAAVGCDNKKDEAPATPPVAATPPGGGTVAGGDKMAAADPEIGRAHV